MTQVVKHAGPLDRLQSFAKTPCNRRILKKPRGPTDVVADVYGDEGEHVKGTPASRPLASKCWRR